MVIKDPEAFADAFTSAVVADLSNPAFLDAGLDAEGLRRLIAADIEKDMKGISGEPLFPRLRAFIRSQMSAEEARYAGSLSQWDVIGQLFTTAADIGAKYLTQKIEAGSQIKIAELQLKAQAFAQAQAEAAAARLAPVVVATQNPGTIMAQGGVIPASGAPAASNFPIVPVAIGVGVGILALGGVYLIARRR